MQRSKITANKGRIALKGASQPSRSLCFALQLTDSHIVNNVLLYPIYAYFFSSGEWMQNQPCPTLFNSLLKQVVG